MIKSTKTIKKAVAVCLSAAMVASLSPAFTNAAVKVKKLTLSKKKITLEIGKSMTVKSTGKANIKAKVIPGGAVRHIKVKSSDRDVVKVKKLNNTGYKITAVDDGSATITVQSLSNKKIKAKLEVTVPEKMDDAAANTPKKEEPKLSARQSSENKVEATFSTGFADNVKIDDFKLNDKTGNSMVALKKLTLSEDKKSVEIEAYIQLNSGSSYELQYTNPVDKKVYTVSINSLKGDVASIKINTKTVPMNIGKKIAYTVLDENGVDITSTAKNYITIKADIPAGKGFYDTVNNELKMFDPSAVAKITVTYQNGTKRVEGTGEIAVTKESTENVSLASWGFSQGMAAFDYNKADNATSKILAKDTANMNFFVSLKTSDGKEIKSNMDYKVKFTSSDSSVFTMVNNTINPMSKGTASIIVEYTYEGKVVKFTPVTVTIGDNAVATALVFNENSAVVTSAGTADNIKVMGLKDQYSNDIDLSKATFTFNCLEALNPLPTATLAGDKIVISGNGAAAHMYRFKADAAVGSSTASMTFEVIVRP